MKIKWKHVGIKLALLLVVICAALSNGGIDTMDRFQVSSEPVVVKAATKEQNKKKKIAAYNKKARKAYRKFLKEYYVEGKSFYHNGQEYKWSDHRSKDRLYAIKDINHDGKVELFIFNSKGSENYLFSYYKNKVQCAAVNIIGGESGGKFLGTKKGKAIVESWSHGSLEYYDLYILQKGTLKRVGRATGQHELIDGIVKVRDIINDWYFNNGKFESISKAKFKKILKKYTGSTDVRAFTIFNMKSKKVKTQLKEIKYKKYKMPTVKPVTGIKLEHQFSYEKSDYEDCYYIDDMCKITWSESVKGNVQIVYSTDKNFKYKTTKTIKASSKKNSFAFKTYGDTYYVKLRAYIGDKVVKSQYSKVYTFTGSIYGRGLKKEDIMYYDTWKDGKSYIWERNLTTNEETKVLDSNCFIDLWALEGDYIYYTLEPTDDIWGDELYVYNLSTKEEKVMIENSYAWSFKEIISGKVICTIDVSDDNDYFRNVDLYIFDLDGTNKQKVLGNIWDYFIYNNQIYWCEGDVVTEEDEFEDEMYYANYIWRKCDLNGENKMDVTDWLYEEAEEVNLSKEYVIENYIENEE